MKWLLCLIPLMIHPVAAQRGLPEGTKVEKNIAYVTGGHERQTLDIFVPPHAENEVLPVVIWIHGGAWMQGSKENCQALPLLGKGYAVVSINYRLSQHAVFPAQIEDCKAAVRWVRAHAKEKESIQNMSVCGDPRRVGIWWLCSVPRVIKKSGKKAKTLMFPVAQMRCAIILVSPISRPLLHNPIPKLVRSIMPRQIHLSRN